LKTKEVEILESVTFGVSAIFKVIACPHESNSQGRFSFIRSGQKEEVCFMKGNNYQPFSEQLNRLNSAGSVYVGKGLNTVGTNYLDNQRVLSDRDIGK
jgi:hypothetical protein